MWAGTTFALLTTPSPVPGLHLKTRLSWYVDEDQVREGWCLLGTGHLAVEIKTVHKDFFVTKVAKTLKGNPSLGQNAQYNTPRGMWLTAGCMKKGVECKKISGQVEGLEEKPLPLPSLLSHFLPRDLCLWLKQHSLKAEKESTCPAALWGHQSGLWVCLDGRGRNHPTGHLVG